jgi:hypothetical protein
VGSPRCASLIPSLSCRACRPHVPLAELVKLSPTSIAGELPRPNEALKIWPVSRAVGNVKNTGPQLAMPV